MSQIPWIRHIFPNQSDYNILMQQNGILYKFLSGLIDTQIATYNPNHERHFVDMYITEMKKAEAMDDKTRGFYCK